jgi:Ca2+-binding RTX toxin-like protein
VTPQRISATRDGDDLVLRDTDATGIVLDEFGQEMEFTVEAGADVIDHYGEGQVEYFVFETMPDHLFAFAESGSEASDFLVGEDGAELIDAGAEDDLLFGNGGNDTLVGGGGDDTMRGGDGGDRFVLDGDDVIADFSVAEGDVLDLQAVLDDPADIAFADSAAGLSMTVADTFTVTLVGLDSTDVDAAFLAQIEV